MPAENQISCLVKFLYLARQKKMVTFTDTSIVLSKVHADHLASIKGPALQITFDDLLALIKLPDTQLVLDTFQLIEGPNWSEPVHNFEYTFALAFIHNCMVTTFPDFRQKFMKSLHHFCVRLRTVYYKDIKKDKNVD